MSLYEEERSHFIEAYARLPIEISHGEGVYLVDISGRRYLDFFGGLAVNILGYASAPIVQAVTTQMSKYAHVSNKFIQETQVKLAKRLAELTGYQRIFFTNSGTEAIEAAIKLVRKWGAGEGRRTIISCSGGFHGRTMGSLSLMDTPAYTEGFEPYLPGFRHIPYNDIAAVRTAVGDETCAVFIEFIQGEGGVRLAEKRYIDTVFSLRDRYGFLVVADEIQSGIGRTGKFCSYEHWGVRPDVITLAKGIGGGLPLGVLLTEEPFAGTFGVGGHGSTFGGNPVACAAGLAVLEICERDRLQEIVSVHGRYFMDGLRELAGRFPEIISDVRGLGLMVGLELKIRGDWFVQKSLEMGMLINCTNGNVLRFLPPFTTSREQIDSALGILDSIFRECNAKGTNSFEHWREEEMHDNPD